MSLEKYVIHLMSDPEGNIEDITWARGDTKFLFEC